MSGQQLVPHPNGVIYVLSDHLCELVVVVKLAALLVEAPLHLAQVRLEVGARLLELESVQHSFPI